MAEDCVVLLPLCDGMRLLLRGQAHGKKGGGIDGQDGCRSRLAAAAAEGNFMAPGPGDDDGAEHRLEKIGAVPQDDETFRHQCFYPDNPRRQSGLDADQGIERPGQGDGQRCGIQHEHPVQHAVPHPDPVRLLFRQGGCLYGGKDAGDEKKGAGGQIVPAGAFLPECADQLQ